MEKYIKNNIVTELQDKIAEYVTRVSDITKWESVRQNYGYYSYMAFLCLTVYELECVGNLDKLCDVIKKYHIEKKEIINFIMRLVDVEQFTEEILDMVSHYGIADVNALYQEYLTHDFYISGQKVVFEEGKNNRDVLGAYYTQENFAYEITRKAIDDYCKNHFSKNEILKVADFSCGGGAFLISTYRICKENKIKVRLYGYDVDPIAVLITRARFVKEMGETDGEINVCVTLGNTLLRSQGNADVVKAFKVAVYGRIYNFDLGICVKDKMDIIVGNPPWEKIRFEEKKFLHNYIEMAEISTKAERKRQLEKETKENRNYFGKILSDYETAKKRIKEDSFFDQSNCGELNTYALFTQLSLNLLTPHGIAGLIIKSSLVKIPVYSEFFRKITSEKNIYELYMFVNRKKIFNIDSREEFSVIYLKAVNHKNLKLALNLDAYTEFTDSKKIELSYELLNLLNPDTGMLPNIKDAKELEFLMNIYKNNRVYGEIYPDCKFGRLVHLTNHSASIGKREEEDYVPVYEGKFIEIYTGKYATFRNIPESEKYKNKACARPIENIDGEEYPESRFFIKRDVWENISRNFEGDFFVAWRSLTSATNRRTMLATLLPLLPTCQSIQVLQLSEVYEMIRVLSLFNSIIFDYIIRMKMAGLDLTQTIIKQIPIPERERFCEKIEFQGVVAPVDTHISSRIYALYIGDKRLKEIFNKVERYEIKKTRKELIAELDKLVAILYQISEKELKQIACSFDRYYSKEEVEEWF